MAINPYPVYCPAEGNTKSILAWLAKSSESSAVCLNHNTGKNRVLTFANKLKEM